MDGSHLVGLGPLLGAESLSLRPQAVSESLSVMRLDAEAALAEYLAGHGLERLSRRLLGRGTLEVLTAAAPGIKDLLVLGKLRQMVDDDVADLFVVDAPASGHALTMLRAAEGFSRSNSQGPVAEQADLARRFLSDPGRCQLCLVTLAEESPITETIETAYAVEEDIGVSLGPVFVNRVWPTNESLAAAKADARRDESDPRSRAARFYLDLAAAQATQLERLQRELPLPYYTVPYRPPMEASEASAVASGLFGHL